MIGRRSFGEIALSLNKWPFDKKRRCRWMLEGRGVTKHFGGLVALKGVDFSLKRGEILGLIGPNGAGKTTLFNIINGFLRPTQGTVVFEGFELNKLKPHQICRLGIGRTFQIVKPFLDCTALENVIIGATFGKRGDIDMKEAEGLALQYLEFVGLSAKRNVLAKNLNIVERKFVEIARALATRPKVMLLDEPLAGLNPTEVMDACKLIKRIRDELNITVFWIEHVMRAMMETAERIIVLHYGEKIAEGNPSEISRNERVIEAYLGGGIARG
jgi:branched-chain amino acid transport system ATP-binding protein